MHKILKSTLCAPMFLAGATGLVFAHGSHEHTDHNQHLVSIVQPEKIYKDGDPVIVEFKARKLLSGIDVGPYTGELKIFLNTKFHIVSDSYGDDFSLGYQGNSCFDNPSYLTVEFDEQGNSVSNDRMHIFTIDDSAEFGRLNLENNDVIYSDGILSHIEVELITGCYSDYDSYIVSTQKFANYLTENSIISEFSNTSKKTAENIEDNLVTAFTDSDDRFNLNLDISSKERIALNADFAYKFNEVTTIWGTGDIADLDGTMGFNLRTGQNSLFGLAGTTNNESLALSGGEYNSEVTTINPFLFFKSEDWSSQLLLMTGYGTGNVHARSGRLNYHDNGEVYIAHFKGLTDIYGPFSIVGEGWYADHYLFKSASSVNMYNSRLSMQVVLENFRSHASVEYDLYTDFAVLIGSNAKFGIYSPYFEWNVLQNGIEGGASVQVNEYLALNASANNVPTGNFSATLRW